MNQTFFGVPGPSSAWAGFLGTLAHANVLIIEPNLSESLVDSFLVPAGRRRRAIAPQRSCVDSADCDSEGDESSPGPAPGQAIARCDRRVDRAGSVSRASRERGVAARLLGTLGRGDVHFRFSQ